MTVPVMAVSVMLAALAITDVLCEALRRAALRRGWTDRPDSRKRHAHPTPQLGGVGMAVGTLIPIALVMPRWQAPLGALVLGAAAVAVLGLIDDLRTLGAAARVLVEGLAAMAIVVSGGGIGLPWAVPDALATVAWIVLIANSFNLLDNMDGAAAGLGGVTAVALAISAALAGASGLALLLVALAASCAGFLFYNWPPALMFMGDAGSLFVGFVLAAACVLIDVPAGLPDKVTGMVLVLFVALVDTTLVVISRRRAGRSWFIGGTDHITHRLHRLGLNNGQVVGVLLAVAVAMSTCGVFVAHGPLPWPLSLAVAVMAGADAIWLLLKIQVYSSPAERSQSPRR